MRSPDRSRLLTLPVVLVLAATAFLSGWVTATRSDDSGHPDLIHRLNPVRAQAVVVPARVSPPAPDPAVAADSLVERFIRSHRNLSQDLARRIHDAAREHGLDPALVFGLIRVESEFRPQVVGGGAVGLMQIMPRTAAGVEPGVTARHLRDPEINLRIGLTYLRQLKEKYDGDVRLALLAYNRGPGTVDRALRRGQDPNNGYADRVLRHSQR